MSEGDGAVDSKWWYGILVIGILEPIAYYMPVILQKTGLYTQEMVQSGEINAFAAMALYLMVGMLFSIPVLAICLHQDATAVGESSLAWNPNPKLWAAAGVGVPLLGFGMGTALIWVVALVYLLRRFRAGPSVLLPDAG